MRTRTTSIRAPIALIKAGSGLIYGTAELVECKPALDLAHLRAAEGEGVLVSACDKLAAVLELAEAKSRVA